MVSSDEEQGQEQEEGREDQEGDGEGEEEENNNVEFVSTACGDFHNLALDKAGLAYSLPSQLKIPGQLGLGSPLVRQVVCGKEHCMLLTEHGQVYT